ncbi:hypothetical protein Y695_03123 [Hydrogenophaga sp. T4]|nr:hypothetical protein Y695_03123 [Hydrogenophaga sp. T4]
MRHVQAERDAGLLDHLVPALHATDAVLDVVVAQHLVERVEHRHFFLNQLAVLHVEHFVELTTQLVVVGAFAFFIAAFQAGAVEGGGVAGFVGAEEVDGDREVEVQVALDGGQVDHAGGAQLGRVVGFQLVHHLAGAVDHAAHARLAHEHVVRFFGEHELGGARQRVEAALGQGAELELAVAVGEVGEHEEGQPVGRLFVEGFEDARVVGVAAVAFQESFAFFAAVLAEVLVQQVDHGPEVAAFFDVHLKEVAQVVLTGAGQAQVALLLDRCRLGVTLRHDDAAQVGAVFAGDVLPGGFAFMVTEVDLAVLFGRVEEDAPAVVGHLDVAELRPALRIDADGGAQVDVEVL